MKVLSAEWAAVIVAISALAVSIVSCVHTRTSNSISERLALLEEARYAENHAPVFSVEYEFPDGVVSNSITARRFLRDLKIYNRGYPVKEINAVMVETFAIVSVFDKVMKNGFTAELSKHNAFYVFLSNHLENRYYNTYRHTFDTKGLLFEAEHGEHQKGLIGGYLLYKAEFPSREVFIDIVDITTIDYKDYDGNAQKVQFLNGSTHCGDGLDKQIREGHAIMSAIQEDDKRHSRSTTLSTILEFCYANEKGLKKLFRPETIQPDNRPDNKGVPQKN